MRHGETKCAGSQLLTLRKRLLATGGGGEDLLALRDGLATESDTLLRVEDGALPDEGLDTTGTTVDLVKSDLVDNLGTMLPMVKEKLVLVDRRFMFRQSCRIAGNLLAEGLDLLDLLGELLSEALLQGLHVQRNY